MKSAEEVMEPINISSLPLILRLSSSILEGDSVKGPRDVQVHQIDEGLALVQDSGRFAMAALVELFI